jgi:hypothetical protein
VEPKGERATASDVEVAHAPEQQTRASEHDRERDHIEAYSHRQEQPGDDERDDHRQGHNS